MTEQVAGTKPWSKQRLMRVAGVWATALGAVLVALAVIFAVAVPGVYPIVGYLLFPIGGSCLFVGLVWLVTSVWASKDPLSAATRRYLRHVFPAMGGYVLAIVALTIVTRADMAVWLKALVALIPVLPMVWVVFSMWRFVRDSDELERRIQMESFYVTCGIVCLLSFAGGMLEIVEVVQIKAGLFYVLPLMFLVYGLVHWITQRRYGFKGVC